VDGVMELKVGAGVIGVIGGGGGMSSGFSKGGASRLLEMVMGAV